MSLPRRECVLIFCLLPSCLPAGVLLSACGGGGACTAVHGSFPRQKKEQFLNATNAISVDSKTIAACTQPATSSSASSKCDVHWWQFSRSDCGYTDIKPQPACARGNVRGKVVRDLRGLTPTCHALKHRLFDVFVAFTESDCCLPACSTPCVQDVLKSCCLSTEGCSGFNTNGILKKAPCIHKILPNQPADL